MLIDYRAVTALQSKMKGLAPVVIIQKADQESQTDPLRMKAY